MGWECEQKGGGEKKGRMDTGGEVTARAKGRGLIRERKIGKKVQAKMGARQGKGVRRREAGMPREKEWEGAGSGRGRLAPFHS